jgi:Zn-dependent M28 family amino/carboxypeptidase
MGDDFNLQEILGWTRDLYTFGFKRPGTHEGHLAEEYLFGLLKGFGIPDVRAEEVPFLGWFHDRVFIAASGSGGSLTIPAEPIVYTGFTPPAGVTGKVVDLGSGSPEEFAGKDLSGKIVLITYSHGYLPYDEALESLSYYLHDPEDTLRGKGQVMSWVTEEERRVYQAAVDAGAIGFIGVFPLEITPYLCFEGGNAFTGRTGSIPGVGLRKSDGQYLKELMTKGEAEITIILTGELRNTVTRNIVGIVPGKSDRVIQVTSHHDSMWLGATEDAAGVAVVLALAKQFAGERPAKTMAFVLEAAECLFVLGSRGYIERHRDDLVRNLIVDLHIEHLALEYVEEDGVLVPTGEIQPRGLFVTDRGPLVEIVKKAVLDNDLRRTILLPTNTPLAVPTDASAYNKAELPVASFISPPLYWNALEDTWDKIAVDEILPTARAYSQIIHTLMETDPDLIRKPGPPGEGYIKE